MSKNSVSICIATKDRSDHLQKTLDSLARVYVPDDFDIELILVDNSSSDNTLQVMRSFTHSRMKVVTLHEKKPGVANARNTAISKSDGNIILWTDDDVRFPEDWIKSMCNPILNKKADVVQGGVRIASHLKRAWMNSRYMDLFASTENLNDPPNRLVTANLAMRKVIFDTIPAFDNELGPGALGFGEDTLLGWQIRKAGYKIILKNDVQVKHCFSENRLNKETLRSIARKQGNSEAYISYHWNHRSWSPVLLYSGILLYYLRLYFKKLLNSKNTRNPEYIPLWEYDHIRRITRFKRHLIERKKERKYERYGLKKNG